MLRILHQRDFSLLWFGGLVSLIGNWMMITALPFYLYQRTGSTLGSGALWVAYALPGLLLGSLAGVFADRWSRKWTMVVVNGLQAISVQLILLVRSERWLWLIYLLAFAESALGQFFVPAEHALLPQLVGEEQVMTANALNALNDSLARIIGPMIGGALVGLAGLPPIVVLDSLSYLFACALIALVAVPATSRERPQRPVGLAEAWLTVWHDLVAGLRLVRREQQLRGVFIAAGTALFADSILTALIVPFVHQVAGGTVQALGVIFTVRGVAGLLGGLVIGMLHTRTHPSRLLGWSLLVIAVLFAVEVNLPYVPLIIAITLLLGVPVIGWLTSQQTLLQLGTRDRYRGRVFGAFGTSNAVMVLVGSSLASLLGDRLGVVPLLNGAAALYGLAGALALWLIGGETRTSFDVPSSTA